MIPKYFTRSIQIENHSESHSDRTPSPAEGMQDSNYLAVSCWPPQSPGSTSTVATFQIHWKWKRFGTRNIDLLFTGWRLVLTSCSISNPPQSWNAACSQTCTLCRAGLRPTLSGTPPSVDSPLQCRFSLHTLFVQCSPRQTWCRCRLASRLQDLVGMESCASLPQWIICFIITCGAQH